jgi:hypothetical protein
MKASFGMCWGRTAAVCLLLCTGCIVRKSPDTTGAEAASQDLGGMTPGVVDAWKNAGCKFGWTFNKEGGTEVFSPKPPDAGEAAADSAVLPGFMATQRPKDGLQGLPAPPVPFGLWLGGNDVTDADLKGLAGFAQLQKLILSDAKSITDAGLKELPSLPQVQTLSLSHTAIRGTTLKELARLPKLRDLALVRTKVNNDTLKELAGLEHLESLDLSFTDISDAGIKELAALKNLQKLRVWNTNVTDAGRTALLKALPKLKFE